MNGDCSASLFFICIKLATGENEALTEDIIFFLSKFLPPFHRDGQGLNNVWKEGKKSGVLGWTKVGQLGGFLPKFRSLFVCDLHFAARGDLAGTCYLTWQLG